MNDLPARLAALDDQGLRRQRRLREGPQGRRIRVDGRDCLNFAGNDFLGLANHPCLVDAACRALGEAGVGAGAAHLLGGHHALHAAFEDDLAGFLGAPAALLFSTGYMANLGVVTALFGRSGEIFSDRLNHASLVDAAILSRARHQRYRHADSDHLESLLRESRAEEKLIVSDAVFSMDGDLAPAAELLRLAERYDARLYLDDAHGFGVLGRQGRGSLDHHRLDPAHPRLVYLATLGKAAGVAGAAVAGSREVVDWLVNRARPYVYTTALPPALAAAASASLRLIAGADVQRRHLAGLVARLRSGTAALPWPLLASATAIQPLLVGSNAEATRLADGLLARGILLPAIRPPTVPQGRARLRIALSAAHSAADVDALLAALGELA